MILPALLAAALLAAPASAPDGGARPGHAKHKAHPAAPPAPEATRSAPAGFPEVPDAGPPLHPLDITADHLTVLPKENRGVWKGHVHAIRAPENGQPELHLKCDELTTTYRDGQQVDTVTCVGAVEVVQGDRAGWGELAVFDNTKGELVVTGNPHGQQGPNTFRGDKLTFDVNSDRIDVLRAFTVMEAKDKALPGQARDGGKP